MSWDKVSRAGQYFLSQERLKGPARRTYLFKHGQRKDFSSLRLYYCSYDVPEKVHQVLFMVPKKHFPLATQRQQLRRRLREAYRKQKYVLEILAKKQVFLLIGYLYTDSSTEPYATIAPEIEATLYYMLKHFS